MRDDPSELFVTREQEAKLGLEIQVDRVMGIRALPWEIKVVVGACWDHGSIKRSHKMGQATAVTFQWMLENIGEEGKDWAQVYVAFSNYWHIRYRVRDYNQTLIFKLRFG